MIRSCEVSQPPVPFDHDYLPEQAHAAGKARMCDSCKYYTIDKGLAGEHPRSRDLCWHVVHSRRLHRSFQTSFGACRRDHGDYQNSTDARRSCRSPKSLVVMNSGRARLPAVAAAARALADTRSTVSPGRASTRVLKLNLEAGSFLVIARSVINPFFCAARWIASLLSQ